jgi:hypothetical protein
MTMQYVNLPDWSNAGLEKIAACNGRRQPIPASPCLPMIGTTFTPRRRMTLTIGTLTISPPAQRSQMEKLSPLYQSAKKKRWLHEPFEDHVDMNDIIVDEGNTTRGATDEEL